DEERGRRLAGRRGATAWFVPKSLCMIAAPRSRFLARESLSMCVTLALDTDRLAAGGSAHRRLAHGAGLGPRDPLQPAAHANIPALTKPTAGPAVGPRRPGLPSVGVARDMAGLLAGWGGARLGGRRFCPHAGPWHRAPTLRLPSLFFLS